MNVGIFVVSVVVLGVVPVLVLIAVVGMIIVPASGSRTNVRVTQANGLFPLFVL